MVSVFTESILYHESFSFRALALCSTSRMSETEQGWVRSRRAGNAFAATGLTGCLLIITLWAKRTIGDIILYQVAAKLLKVLP